MKKRTFLCGPVEIPDFVLKSLHRESFSHRTPEYEDIHRDVVALMQKVFGTSRDIYVVTASGTGAMEASITNCFSPGDHVVVPIVGNFSTQFSTMLQKFGLKVTEVPFEYGASADPSVVEPYLKEDVKGLFVVHNESSSGVSNDLEAFGKLTRDTPILLVTDSVSGAGGLPLKMDEWGVDIVITASQKCLMSPAGLSFIALSAKAEAAMEHSSFPSYYFGLDRFKEKSVIHQTPTTPGIYTLIAVQRALHYLNEEGFEQALQRTKSNAERLRQGLKELGLDLVAKDGAIASDTLSTVRVPDAKDFRKKLKEKGFIIAGGLPPHTEDTVRIGTMGYVFKEDIEALLSAIKEVLNHDS